MLWQDVGQHGHSHVLGPEGGEGAPGHGCPTSQMGGWAIPLPQAASPALPQPCDRSWGQGEDMELHGTGKLCTSWPQCPQHIYFISSAIVCAHKQNGSSTDASQHPSKQSPPGRLLSLGFEGITTRGEPQLVFFLETRAFPMPSLLWMLVTTLLLMAPSLGLREHKWGLLPLPIWLFLKVLYKSLVFCQVC